MLPCVFLFCILQYRARYAMNGIIVTIAILEGIVAIFASTLGCRSLCCGGTSEVHCRFAIFLPATTEEFCYDCLTRFFKCFKQMFQTQVKSGINSTPQLLWTSHSKRIGNFFDAFIFRTPSLCTLPLFHVTLWSLALIFIFPIGAKLINAPSSHSQLWCSVTAEEQCPKSALYTWIEKIVTLSTWPSTYQLLF